MISKRIFSLNEYRNMIHFIFKKNSYFLNVIIILYIILLNCIKSIKIIFNKQYLEILKKELEYNFFFYILY